jgi:hypothetical protein
MRTPPPSTVAGSRWRGATVAVTTVLAVVAAPAAASAQTTAFDRGTDAACGGHVHDEAPFADVAPSTPHASAIDCLTVYGVVEGRLVSGRTVYRPGSDVTRQHMASFVARALDALGGGGYALPASTDGDPDFVDARSIDVAHRDNVDRLRRAGIVSGYGDGTFHPDEPIDRAQMASFLARAIEDVTGAALATPGDSPFTDIAGTHGRNVEKLAAIGVVQGRTTTAYAPSATTTRAQMATMIARTLDYLTTEGHLRPVAFASGTAANDLGLADVTTTAHDGSDRVTLTLGGDDGLAGWRVRYVDEAIEHGSGDPIEVAGNAILELTLTGMAFPPDLAEEPWAGGRLDASGVGVTEVVDRGVYEGQQQVFIGTTGPHPFAVARHLDPQRVVIDVDHGA